MAQAGADEDDAGGSLTARRVSSALEVAKQFGTGMSLEELTELLPENGPQSASETREWLRVHPASGVVVGPNAFHPQVPILSPDADRGARALSYWRAAQQLADSVLAPVTPMLRYLGVTGSTAYGEPEVGDDCDFMAVARAGAIWPFLTLTFLRLRLRRRLRRLEDPPAWCFNYVVDEAAAARDFGRPRGFLFAREALMTRPLRGETYYRGLLRSAVWLQTEAPRLYARWRFDGLPEPEHSGSGTWPLRAFNLLLFPWVAAYLQLKNLVQNRRLRGQGRPEECFRTITRIDRMALVTLKFDRLAEAFVPATRLRPE